MNSSREKTLKAKDLIRGVKFRTEKVPKKLKSLKHIGDFPT
jgi:hypothetical protein